MSYDRAIEYAGGDNAFAAWLTLVHELWAKLLPYGPEIFDLADYDWGSQFEADAAPSGALRDAVDWWVGFGDIDLATADHVRNHLDRS